MTAYMKHPVLHQMLGRKCCSPGDVGRYFKLYMSLCEEYRVPHVEWDCDREKGFIYMHTRGVEQSTIQPTQHTPADTEPTQHADEEDSIQSQDEDGEEQDCARRKDDKQEDEKQTSPAAKKRVSEFGELFCVGVDCSQQLNDGFVRYLQSKVDREYSTARLSIVPLHHWEVMGNYSVTDGIEDGYEDDQASTELPHQTGHSLEDTLNADIGTADHETQITAADAEENSAALVCYPEAHLTRVHSSAESGTDGSHSSSQPINKPQRELNWGDRATESWD